MTMVAGERHEVGRSTSDRRWDRFRWCGAALALIGAVLLLTQGTRQAPYSELVGKVALGEVRSVQIVGELPSEATSGVSTVEVFWREGWRDYVAQVRQVRREGQPERSTNWPQSVFDSTEQIPTVRQAPGDQLLLLQPGLALTRSDVGDRPSSGVQATFYGVRVGGWLVWWWLGLLVGFLALLLSGPEPWRATRWAWFWLAMTPAASVIIVLFVVFSGPTPLLREPRDVNRRLTGGWAFLLAFPLAAMVKQQTG